MLLSSTSVTTDSNVMFNNMVDKASLIPVSAENSNNTGLILTLHFESYIHAFINFTNFSRIPI